MLTTIGKQNVPALLREVAKSPKVYPAMSHAVEVVTSSAKFTSLSPAKKKIAPYRVIHAPRPKPELQSWNVHHGTTSLSAAQHTLMQLQGWNHHDPLSQLLGNLPDRLTQTTPPAIDVIEMAKEIERIEEDALDEIAVSTGRAGPSKEEMNHATNLKFPYYPQYASDLIDKSYEMENTKLPSRLPSSNRHPPLLIRPHRITLKALRTCAMLPTRWITHQKKPQSHRKKAPTGCILSTIPKCMAHRISSTRPLNLTTLN